MQAKFCYGFVPSLASGVIHCYAIGMLELDELVRRMRAERRGEWPRIAREADVSHSWISQFVRCKIGNPGYSTLRRLYIQMTTPRESVKV